MSQLEKAAAPAALLVTILLSLSACANPADGKVEAQVGDPQADAADAAPVQGTTYVIGEGSTIGFTGSKVTGSHEGGFHAFEGTITLGEGGPTASSVEVVIDTTSLWANDDRLTTHLQSPDFFDVESYPTARFSSTAIAQTADGFEMTGELELHGVTKQVTFPATIEVGEGRITARAEFVIKRFDFGIVYPGKPDDLIRDEVVVRLDLVAVPQAG